MNNKNILLPVISGVALVAVVGGAYFLSPKGNNMDTQDKVDNSNKKVLAEEDVQPIEDTKVEETVKTQEEMMIPATAVKYSIKSGEVSYSAMKTYSGKPETEVIGKTDVLKGSGWLDEATKTGYIDVSLNFSDVKSPSEQRDKDIAPLFIVKDITLKGSMSELAMPEIDKDTKFVSKYKVSINGIERDVEFTITAKKDKDENIMASGEAQIMLTDFGITAPTLAGVFSVDNKVKIMFNIIGEKIISLEAKTEPTTAPTTE